MRIVRSTLIGTAVAVALFGRNGMVQADTPASASGSAPANAAATAPADAAGTGDAGAADLQEVVVTGFRASVEASLETKREATGVEDVLAAEDVDRWAEWSKVPENKAAYDAVEFVSGALHQLKPPPLPTAEELAADDSDGSLSAWHETAAHVMGRQPANRRPQHEHGEAIL